MSDTAKLAVLKELLMAAKKRKPRGEDAEGESEMNLPEMDLSKTMDLPEMDLRSDEERKAQNLRDAEGAMDMGRRAKNTGKSLQETHERERQAARREYEAESWRGSGGLFASEEEYRARQKKLNKAAGRFEEADDAQGQALHMYGTEDLPTDPAERKRLLDAMRVVKEYEASKGKGK